MLWVGVGLVELGWAVRLWGCVGVFFLSSKRGTRWCYTVRVCVGLR